MDRFARFERFYLYGATPAADGVMALLARHGKSAIAFVDRDLAKQAEPFKGLSVISPEALCDAPEDSGIIIVSAYQMAIHQFLVDNKIDRDRLFPLLDGMFLPTYSADFLASDRLNTLEETLAGHDQRFFASWRRFKSSGHLDVLEPFDVKHAQYHRPDWLASIKPGGLALDIGAFDGASSLGFLETGIFRSVEAFEPFAENFAKLQAIAKANPSLVAHQLALGDRAKEIRLEKAGLDSRARVNASDKLPPPSDDAVAEIIHVKPLDAMNISDISMIKVDIEGDEMLFLEGAAATIKRDRPHMALSAYHHRDHPEAILAFLDGLNISYQISVGHHPLAVYELEYYVTFDG